MNKSVGPFLFVAAIAGVVLWYWRRQRIANAFPVKNNEVKTDVVGGAVAVGPSTVPEVAEHVIISSIPIVGPVLNYAVTTAGTAIFNSQTLTDHSQVAPGRSENKAGVFGFTVSDGITWSEAGHDIKKGAQKLEFWNW